MAIWAIADLHLSVSTPDKDMAIFGEPWIDYMEKIERHWRERIADSDLVLIAGDISWAKRAEEAKIDLEFIDRLPGTKVLCKGNHDYWWESQKKVLEILPPSLHLIHNNAFDWHEVSIAGTRLWDNPEFNFDKEVVIRPNPRAKAHFFTTPEDDEMNEKIFVRELARLEMSLQQLNPNAGVRIAMVHYPPLSGDLQESRTSQLLERYGVDICVFGHVHSVKEPDKLFGTRNGVRYLFTAADALDFIPVRLL
jgi:uncharacterized protein